MDEDQKPKKPKKHHVFLELQRSPSFEPVKKMLADGASPWIVAEWLQGRGEFTGIKKASIARRLKRLKITEGPDLRVIPQSMIDTDTSHVDRALWDEYDELVKLILTQKARIEKDLKAEKDSPKLIATLRPEIVTLTTMLQTASTMAMNLGLRKKVPDKHLHFGVQVGDATLSEVLKQAGPEQALMLRQAIQQVWTQTRTTAPKFTNEGGEDSSVPSSRQGDQSGHRETEVPVVEQTDPVPSDDEF